MRRYQASAFYDSAGNTATPAYPVANRTLDAVWICTTHGNHFFTTGNTNTGSFAAFLIRQFVLNQSVDCLMLKRLPIPPRINSHVDGFRETKITNNLFPFLVYM
jgi:hypothetical protein